MEPISGDAKYPTFLSIVYFKICLNNAYLLPDTLIT